jgi:creatinine amidohydrolase
MHSSDLHAGEGETSDTMLSRPDLVHLDRAGQESGTDLHRLNLPDGLYAGIGEFDMKAWTAGVAEVICAVKADKTSMELQNQFYDDAKHPLDTTQ